MSIAVSAFGELTGGLRLHKTQGADQEIFQFAAGDDGVEHAVFEQELGALEALGELLADGLLDDAGAGEADEGAGFGDVEIAEHGERSRHAASGGVGEDGQVGEAGRVEAGEGGGDLSELHEAHDALLHAGAAGGRNDDESGAGVVGAIDGAGDGFAYDRAHGTADKGELHDGEGDRVRADVALSAKNGVVETGVALCHGEAGFVSFEVGELERVGGAEVAVDKGVAGFKE